jgi:hypothetical protein
MLSPHTFQHALGVSQTLDYYLSQESAQLIQARHATLPLLQPANVYLCLLAQTIIASTFNNSWYYFTSLQPSLNHLLLQLPALNHICTSSSHPLKPEPVSKFFALYCTGQHKLNIQNKTRIAVTLLYAINA